MSQYTLEELHTITANQVNDLIKEGYRINSNKSVSDKKNEFIAVLNKDDFEVVIYSTESYDVYSKTIDIYNSNTKRLDRSLFCDYYRVYNKYYCDSKYEAEDLRKKYYEVTE